MKLKLAADQTNKQCPYQVDNSTILVNVEALPENILKYNYKVNLKEEIKDTIKAKRLFRHKILYNIKNNPSLKSLRDAKVSFVYSYKDTKDRYLFQIKITPNEYLKDQTSDLSLAELIESAADFNKNLIPMQLDEVTVMKDCQYAAPDTLVMIYDLNANRDQISETKLILFKETLIKSTKADASSTELRDKNCIFKHVYEFPSGEPITIVITPKDYK